MFWDLALLSLVVGLIIQLTHHLSIQHCFMIKQSYISSNMNFQFTQHTWNPVALTSGASFSLSVWARPSDCDCGRTQLRHAVVMPHVNVQGHDLSSRRTHHSNTLPSREKIYLEQTRRRKPGQSSFLNNQEWIVVLQNLLHSWHFEDALCGHGQYSVVI